MSTNFQLRLFQPADLPALLELEKAIFPFDAFGRREFGELYRRGRDTFLVAVADQTIAGYIVAYRHGKEGYIASIGVATAFQRQGLGRLLLDTIGASLKGSGATSLGLHVRDDNASAIAFYRQYGFVMVKQIQNFYGVGIHGWYATYPIP